MYEYRNSLKIHLIAFPGRLQQVRRGVENVVTTVPKNSLCDFTMAFANGANQFHLVESISYVYSLDVHTFARLCLIGSVPLVISKCTIKRLKLIPKQYQQPHQVPIGHIVLHVSEWC